MIFEYFLVMPNFVKAAALAAAFLILLLLIFFLLVKKRRSSKASSKRLAKSVNEMYSFAIKEIEDTGAPSGVTRYPGGLLAAASAYQGYDLSPSGNGVIYEQNGIPYINSDLARKNNQGVLDSTFKKLVESVTNAACSGTEG